MFKKHVILAVTILLILSKGAGAETEREVIVNHTQNATWAYYTDDTDLANVSPNSRWYISPISSVTVRTDAYSLGPISNGVAGWWTVGLGVATFDLSFSNISVAPNLDNDPSNIFLDFGLKVNVTDPKIHSDRQKLQGKTHPIEWYFFQASDDHWYIVNDACVSVLQVLRFAAKDGKYDWRPVDVSGYSYTAVPDPNGNSLTIKFVSNGSQSRFLSFPLDCGRVDVNNNCTFPYSGRAYTTGSINSVLDHAMLSGKVYDFEGTVTAYTGETGKGPKKDGGCYPKDGGGSFSVNGLYNGTDDGCKPAEGLNYDGHPGYDYYAEENSPVKAAAGGTVVYIQNLKTNTSDICVPKGIPDGCSAWGYVGIDNGNGYVIQYGHLSRIDVHVGDPPIKEGQQIGLSGHKAPSRLQWTLNNAHLHFEVLKANPGAEYGYSVVDPYGWEGTSPNDPDLLCRITGIKNVPLWK